MAKPKKYYGVQVGRQPGVYESWDECKSQVDGFPGAKFKGFITRDEAVAYSQNKVFNVKTQKYEGPNVSDGVEIYVDGSYYERQYAYGVVILLGDKEIHLNGVGSDPDMVSMQNVAGEVMGATAAIQWAIDNNIPKIVIYHDYAGISEWATGAWKRNKKGTEAYYNFCREAKDKVDVQFVKVKGHSHNFSNDVADGLARKALGIDGPVAKKVKDHIENIECSGWVD